MPFVDVIVGLFVLAIILGVMFVLPRYVSVRSLVLWLDKDAYKEIGPADSYLKAKADIYATIGGMARGPMLRLLLGICREIIAGDTRISFERVQGTAPDIAEIAQKLSPAELVFLCLEVSDHTIENQLTGAIADPS